MLHMSVMLFCVAGTACAQKYNFIPYSVGEGLAQSQPTCFAQNFEGLLFIGSFGGLSQFDGSSFVNYNKSDGMPHNVVLSIASDKNYNLWMATPHGISKFDGRIFKNYYPKGPSQENSASQVVVDGRNSIWALVASQLFRFREDRFIREFQVKDTSICLTTDQSGNLWVFRYPEGIYVWNGQSWHQELDTHTDRQMVIYKMAFGSFSGTLYCITSQGLKIVDKGKLISPEWWKTQSHKSFPTSVLEDSKGNIWVAGNDGGAWAYDKKQWIHYTYENGFSNETVTAFYEDTEGNIWLATNGSGMFRFAGNSFTYYDRGSGFSSPSIMSIAQLPSGDLFFTGSNNGLFRMHGGKLNAVKLPLNISKINALHCDESGLLWIGTDFSGLWTFDGRNFKSFPQKKEAPIFGISYIYADSNGMWVTALNGLFRISENHVERALIQHSVYTVESIGSDSLLIGTVNGAYVYHTDTHSLEQKPLLANATVLCLASDKHNVYIGTDDRGVIVWNRERKKLLALNQDSGLSCNYVYSLLRDRNHNIWVGTGCGIDKITVSGSHFSIKRFGSSEGLQGLENNSNASFEDASGNLWFGTNKGVFRYNPFALPLVGSSPPPKVILQSIKLFSRNMESRRYADSLLPFHNIPYNPVFPPNQNNLSFMFKGICLGSADQIRYRYQLVGIDKAFTETNQTTVIYPSLPPGDYIFKVWASDPLGHWHANALTYPFTINTPYYKTWYFRIGCTLLLLGLLLGAVYWRNKMKSARLTWEHRLREEEQDRVRQRTAEDFHDEIGNKLTRINLLTTVAKSKLARTPEEVPSMLNQIQKNVSSLYSGAQDIIWSLQPQSDFLDELIFRIRKNMEDMLQDSAVQFRYQHDGDPVLHIKLPFDYSRNLIMIFKEAVNNLVKHSGARQVRLTTQRTGKEFIFFLEDDGTGFDPEAVREGNGLKNIRNRADRIKADLLIERKEPSGMRFRLNLSLQGIL
jgi:signal transduction histidine kinase/ligand-binding sensor domain-containing protein